jgi:hypothetical protein
VRRASDDEALKHELASDDDGVGTDTGFALFVHCAAECRLGQNGFRRRP